MVYSRLIITKVHFHEEIVKTYFEIQGYFVRTNIRFKINKANSDIDLAIIHPKTNDKAIISVKGWNRVFYAYYIKNVTRRKGILRFISKEGIEKAEDVLDTNQFRRILVIQRLPKKKSARDEVIQFLKRQKIEIILFSTILEKLIKHVKLNPDYPESNILESIRLLKFHKLIK